MGSPAVRVEIVASTVPNPADLVDLRSARRSARELSVDDPSRSVLLALEDLTSRDVVIALLPVLLRRPKGERRLEEK
ncbi:MAG: hypothetical protein ACREEC_14740 [Thermoplasmata archaeon]